MHSQSVVYTTVGVACGVVAVVAILATLAFFLLKPRPQVHSESHQKTSGAKATTFEVSPVVSEHW